MKRHLLNIGGLTLLAGLLTGCSGGGGSDAIVAQVEDRPILMSDYEKAWATVSPEYLPASGDDLAGRREFLDTMINKEIMALKADELGYDKDEYVVAGMEAFREVGLPTGYLKVKVANKVTVTEKDLREAYKHYGKVLTVRQILVDTEPEALEVIEMLNRGEDFVTVAKEYSKAPEAAEGGRVLTAKWGTFPPDFQDKLFNTPVGDITPPILSRYGYFVLKVISEKMTSNETYEQVKPKLEPLVRSFKEISASHVMSDDLRARHNFQFYDQNLKIAFSALPPDRPVTNPPNRSEEIYPILRFEPRDLDKPLVTWDDKSITIRDFSDLYDSSSYFVRPRREFRLGDMRKFLLDQIMPELIEIELEESGIEHEPEVAAMLDRKREQLMVDKLYRDLVDGQTQISQQELVKYYNDNMEQYRRPEERRFHAVLAGDKAGAEEARQKMLMGENIDLLRKHYGLPEIEVQTNLHDRFFAKGQQPEIDRYGYALSRIGQVSDVFEVSEGWVVIKLVEKTPERILPLAEAEHEIRHYLKTVANEDRLNELLAKWREDYEIVVNENNLKKAHLSRARKPQLG